MRLPRVRITVRRMMLAAAVVAACLSFGARAQRLRSTAEGQVRQYSARLARGHGRSTPEEWREYQKAEADLHKADFLESFGIVVMILIPILAAGVLLWPGRRPAPAPNHPATPDDPRGP